MGNRVMGNLQWEELQLLERLQMARLRDDSMHIADSQITDCR
jgi:hypothetical protein